MVVIVLLLEETKLGVASYCLCIENWMRALQWSKHCCYIYKDNILLFDKIGDNHFSNDV